MKTIERPEIVRALDEADKAAGEFEKRSDFAWFWLATAFLRMLALLVDAVRRLNTSELEREE